jgi:hypothetical protein
MRQALYEALRSSEKLTDNVRLCHIFGADILQGEPLQNIVWRVPNAFM